MLKHLTAAVLLVGVLTLPALAQDQLRPTKVYIDVNMKNASFSDVIADVGKQAGITIRYEGVKPETLGKHVSAVIKDALVRDAIAMILKPYNLTYKVIDENTILVSEAK